MADVLATLADSRLVTVSEGNVEVAHEALLREWPRLREWIEEDAEGRRLRRHITQAATEWDAAGRDQGELYRGARLAAALDWTADHALDVNELEREFVTESREASEKETKRVRRTNRRLRGLLAGVAVLLAAAVAGGIFAVVQRGEARDAETAQFVQRLGAQALVEEDLDLSLLLARQAVAIDDSPQTRGYLLATLRRRPAAIGIMHGRRRRAQGNRRQPRREDAGRGGWPRRDSLLRCPDLRADRGPAAAERTPAWRASRTAPTGEPSRSAATSYIRLIDARTREQLAEAAVDGAATRMAFTKDGSQLVVLVAPGLRRDLGEPMPDHDPRRRHAGADRSLDRAGRLRRRVRRQSGTRHPSFALTPDDRSLVTASEDGELALVGSPEPQEDADAGGSRPASRPRSPSARTAAPWRSASSTGSSSSTSVPEPCERQPATLAGSPNWVLFSPDGEDGRGDEPRQDGDRWDVESATPLETLRGHSNFVQQPVFSPDGETLYTVSHDGTAIAWDSRATAGSGGRSRSRTTGRSPGPAMTATRGGSAPTAG